MPRLPQPGLEHLQVQVPAALGRGGGWGGGGVRAAQVGRCAGGQAQRREAGSYLPTYACAGTVGYALCVVDAAVSGRETCAPHGLKTPTSADAGHLRVVASTPRPSDGLSAAAQQACACGHARVRAEHAPVTAARSARPRLTDVLRLHRLYAAAPTTSPCRSAPSCALTTTSGEHRGCGCGGTCSSSWESSRAIDCTTQVDAEPATASSAAAAAAAATDGEEPCGSVGLVELTLAVALLVLAAAWLLARSEDGAAIGVGCPGARGGAGTAMQARARRQTKTASSPVRAAASNRARPRSTWNASASVGAHDASDSGRGGRGACMGAVSGSSCVPG